MPWYRTTVKSGPLVEVYEYFSRRKADDKTYIPRGPNENATEEDQQKRNDTQSWKAARRIMCCNFSRSAGDMLVTFPHRPGTTEAQARMARRNLIASIGRRMEKKELVFRWLAVTEKQSQWHHHIVMSGGLTLFELQGLWSEGFIKASPVDEKTQFAGLARYFTEEHKPRKGNPPSAPSVKEKRGKHAKRWSCSRNVKRPEIDRVEIGPPAVAEPTPEKGYRLLPTWFIDCDGFGNLFRFFECVREALPGSKERRRKAKGGGP